MKKFDEEENEDMRRTLMSLFSAKKKHFEKIFPVDAVSFTKLKMDFWKFFVRASLSQNLENSAFWPILIPIFHRKVVVIFYISI